MSENWSEEEKSNWSKRGKSLRADLIVIPCGCRILRYKHEDGADMQERQYCTKHREEVQK